MSVSLGHKVIKEKQLSQDLKLKVSKNEASERIFVEFSSADGKIVLQRNYQDNIAGREEAKKFEKKFKSLSDLKKYFGVR
jgi:hypothetical protein